MPTYRKKKKKTGIKPMPLPAGIQPLGDALIVVKRIISLAVDDYSKRRLSPLEVNEFEVDYEFQKTILLHIEMKFGKGEAEKFKLKLKQMIAEEVLNALYVKISPRNFQRDVL